MWQKTCWFYFNIFQFCFWPWDAYFPKDLHQKICACVFYLCLSVPTYSFLSIYLFFKMFYSSMQTDFHTWDLFSVQSPVGINLDTAFSLSFFGIIHNQCAFRVQDEWYKIQFKFTQFVFLLFFLFSFKAPKTAALVLSVRKTEEHFVVKQDLMLRVKANWFPSRQWGCFLNCGSYCDASWELLRRPDKEKSLQQNLMVALPFT